VKKISNSVSVNYNKNSANNPSKDIYQDMAKIMRDNGFKDAARYMQTGNYAAMTDYMNNLSQEDYDKMIKIMNDNGYGYMAQRMQSIGKEGMTQIHNSIMGNGSYSNGMMGNFK
jgi:predicted Ser/Thr protein kinase